MKNMKNNTEKNISKEEKRKRKEYIKEYLRECRKNRSNNQFKKKNDELKSAEVDVVTKSTKDVVESSSNV